MTTPMSSDAALPSFEVAVIEADPRVRTRITVALSEALRPAAFPSLEAAEGRLHGSGVLVLGPSYGEASALTTVSRMLRDRPTISAVLVIHDLTTEGLQAAMRAGVNDVVTLDNAATELFGAISRAAEAHDVHLARGRSGGGDGDGPSRGRITTVFSTKGGVGTSVLATNLAVSLAKGAKRPVVLIDGDLQFGDVAVMLQLNATHTVADAARQADRFDAELARSMLTEHEPSGVFVLPAPSDPAAADGISAAAFVRVLEVLAGFCDHVVVDTPTSFDDVVLATIEMSDDLIYVAAMDIPTIKNVKLGLQTLRRLNLGSGKIRLAVNRANSKVRLDISEVERTLQLKAECLLPSDVAVPRSLNKGAPVVLESPRSGVSRALERLATQFRHPTDVGT
ncbi:MAG: AAA family ATPase [Acidimicrobiales bacterium]